MTGLAMEVLDEQTKCWKRSELESLRFYVEAFFKRKQVSQKRLAEYLPPSLVSEKREEKTVLPWDTGTFHG